MSLFYHHEVTDVSEENTESLSPEAACKLCSESIKKLPFLEKNNLQNS
jgi:hypothetical protein